MVAAAHRSLRGTLPFGIDRSRFSAGVFSPASRFARQARSARPVLSSLRRVGRSGFTTLSAEVCRCADHEASRSPVPAGVNPPATLSIMTPERALDQSDQLIGSPIDGLVDGRGILCNRDGLAALQSGFHQAALVVLAALIAVLIAQMNLYSCNVIANPVQGISTTPRT